MANVELKDFTAKTAPVGADIIYMADSANGFKQVKVTATNYISSLKLPTISGAIVAGNMPVWDTSGTVADSGITIDHSQNLTNVGTINGITITNALIKTNNLSDVSNAGTARTNLGLGTAATKTASGAGATVASVTGTFTVGHAAVFADTSGTIQDGGSTSGFLLSANNLSDVANAGTSRTNLGLGTAATHAATDFLLVANNLSDVANKTTAFNNVSPLTSKGDLLGFDGSNNVRVGNNTNGLVLTTDSTAAAGFSWQAVPSPGDNVRVITGATVLTSDDFGKTILCEGLSSYTVTLPAATAGTNQFIYFVFDLNPQVFVTVAPAGVDIIVGPGSALNAYPFGDGEYLQVMTDGNAWFPAATLQPCNFIGGLTNTITSSGSMTPIPFNLVTKYNMTYNAVTGYVTPIYPGRYRITVQITGPQNSSAYNQAVGVTVVGDKVYYFSAPTVTNQSNNSISFTRILYFPGTGSAPGNGTFAPVYQSSRALSIGGASGDANNFCSIDRVSNY